MLGGGAGPCGPPPPHRHGGAQQSNLQEQGRGRGVGVRGAGRSQQDAAGSHATPPTTCGKVAQRPRGKGCGVGGRTGAPVWMVCAPPASRHRELIKQARPPRRVKRLLCAQISRQPLSPQTANGGEGLGAVGGERRIHKRKRPRPRCLVPVATTQCRQQPDGTYALGRMTAALLGRGGRTLAADGSTRGRASRIRYGR